MRVAAYQAPLLEGGSMEVIDRLREQVAVCEAERVEILCCPETVLGGLADYAREPFELAFGVENGAIEKVLTPLTSDTVSTIVGITESSESGALYNTAVIFHRGTVMGRYRKVYPKILLPWSSILK